MSINAVRILRLVGPRRQCRECPTIIPSDRQLCYFHSKPPVPYSAPESRLEHVRNHLREQDRPFLDGLLQPMSLLEIANQLGEGWTPRTVEVAWLGIRDSMGLADGSRGNKPHLERLALLRIVAGMDACPICE